MADPFFSNVTLLLQMRNDVLVEESGKVDFSIVGGGVLSAAQALYGTKSFFNPGTNTALLNYIQVTAKAGPDAAGLTFPLNTDFTIEHNFYWDTPTNDNDSFITSQVLYPTAGFWFQQGNPSTAIAFNSSSGGVVLGGNVSLDAWHKLIIVRAGIGGGARISIYIDDVRVATATSYNGQIGGGLALSALRIFAGSVAAVDNGDVNGFFAACRVTNGVARYNPALTNIVSDNAPYPLAVDPVTVPNILNLTEAAAEAAILGATLAVGAVTTAHSPTVPEGRVISQDPVGGTEVSPDSPVDFVLSLGPVLVIVPQLVGFTTTVATQRLTTAQLTLGAITLRADPAPVGTIIEQTPPADSHAVLGSAVSVVVSSGIVRGVVPQLLGKQLDAAAAALTSAGLALGKVTIITDPVAPLGSIYRQSIPAGTVVDLHTTVDVVQIALVRPFNFGATVISQYAQAPTINALVESMADSIDPAIEVTQFYDFVWNVNTAVGRGLDVWGRIVGVSRALRIPGSDPIVGFWNADLPYDWQPMSQGRFSRGDTSGQAYVLPDDAYRVLVLTKALANIVATNAQNLNRLLRNLFPGRGRVYVRDLGGMAMQFVFNFSLTPTEFAILTQSGVLPHPAGVFYSVIVVPTGKLFGFRNSNPGSVRPFNYGVFHSR